MIKQRIFLFITAVLLLGLVVGCGKKTATSDTPSKVEMTTASQEKDSDEGTKDDVEGAEEEADKEASSSEAQKDDSDEQIKVHYGDEIKVSCTREVRGAVSEDVGVIREDRGESSFVVSYESDEFQLADYELDMEELEKNVNKAIGKSVGDTFELSFEGGDGMYTYIYTILEITPKDQIVGPADWQRKYKEFIYSVTHDFEHTYERQGDSDSEFVDEPLPESYDLVYVNDDEIPELLLHYYTGPGNWYEFLYTIEDGNVVRVDFGIESDNKGQNGDYDLLSIGWRASYGFKEKDGKFVIEDGTGFGHYWKSVFVYDMDAKKMNQQYYVMFQGAPEYSLSGSPVSKEEFEKDGQQYFDEFWFNEDSNALVYEGFDFSERKDLTWENVAEDLGEDEVSYESETQDGFIGNDCSYTIPSGFYDSSFACGNDADDVRKRFYWNNDYKMLISITENIGDMSGDAFDEDSMYNTLCERERYTVDYQVKDDGWFVVSGHKPDGTTIYYTKNIQTDNRNFRIQIEYPMSYSDKCDKLCENFLNSFSY